MTQKSRACEPDGVPWQCPTCRSPLTKGELSCSRCGKGPRRDAGFLDFSALTPKLEIGLSGLLQQVHEQIGATYPDLAEDPRVRRALEEIARHAQGGLCLEIGCANGPMTPALTRIFDRVVALEHAESMLRATAERAPSACCILADANYLPLADKSVDFVVCTEVLEHTASPTQILLEIRRVLKAGGLAYVTVPNCKSPNLFKVSDPGLKVEDTHVNFWDSRGFYAVLIRCGFDVPEIRTGTAHVTLGRILRRPGLLLRRLPGMGAYTECFIRPAVNPTACWEEYVAGTRRRTD